MKANIYNAYPSEAAQFPLLITVPLSMLPHSVSSYMMSDNSCLPVSHWSDTHRKRMSQRVIGPASPLLA